MPVDYAALAKQLGGDITPADAPTKDYAAMAAQHGGTVEPAAPSKYGTDPIKAAAMVRAEQDAPERAKAENLFQHDLQRRLAPFGLTPDVVKGIGQGLYRTAAGLVTAIGSPVETAKGIVSNTTENARAAVAAAKEGRYADATTHAVSAVPLVGPAAVDIGSGLTSEDPAEQEQAVGRAAGFAVAPKLIDVAPGLAVQAGRGAVTAVKHVPRTAMRGVAAVGDVISPDIIGAISPRAGKIVDVAQRIRGKLADGAVDDTVPYRMPPMEGSPVQVEKPMGIRAQRAANHSAAPLTGREVTDALRAGVKPNELDVVPREAVLQRIEDWKAARQAQTPAQAEATGRQPLPGLDEFGQRIQGEGSIVDWPAETGVGRTVTDASGSQVPAPLKASHIGIDAAAKPYEVRGQLQFPIDRNYEAPGAIFRGITSAEAESIAKTGSIKSTGAYSHSSEGTSFGSSFAESESVVNVGRDNPLKTGKPTYVVQVKKGPQHVADPRDSVVKSQAATPADQIERVWRFDPDGQVSTYTSMADALAKPSTAPLEAPAVVSPFKAPPYAKPDLADLPKITKADMKMITLLREQYGAEQAGRLLRTHKLFAGIKPVERTNLIRSIMGDEAGLMPQTPQAAMDAAMENMSLSEQRAYLAKAPNAAAYKYIASRLRGERRQP